jgi:hypothetical protein
MSSAEEFDASAGTDGIEMVSSVEVCECPQGYHGYSCEDCSVGYFRKTEGPYGPICEPCNCHGHADTCHPLTGECVTLVAKARTTLPEPKDEDGDGVPDEEDWTEFCHFRPDLCEIVTTDEV